MNMNVAKSTLLLSMLLLAASSSFAPGRTYPNPTILY
jgi:hypothetical protein